MDFLTVLKAVIGPFLFVNLPSKNDSFYPVFFPILFDYSLYY